jgi:2-succinyl-6-hydroxy-2,4-cyclohexadiene-1-carboxylate synthase
MALATTLLGPFEPPEAAPGGMPLRRIVLAHGFTQNARCWGRFGHLLTRHHEVVAVDLPGHGRSPAVHDEADLADAGRLLGEAGGPGVYIGYSMGGRTALHTAIDPAVRGRVEALVLIGATPGLPTDAARAERIAADEALAEGLLRDGLEEFLDRWLALPLFAGLPLEDAHRGQRMANRPEGLAASLRNCGTGTQSPLWGRIGSIDVPVLVLAGSRDAKFIDIGRRMAAAIGASASFEAVPGAGHAAHAERPEVVSALIDTFIGQTPARGRGAGQEA